MPSQGAAPLSVVINFVQEIPVMLRFAPRYGMVSPALIRPSRLRRRFAVNDNVPGTRAVGAIDPEKSVAVPAIADARVQAALRLFAAHGLSAAEQADRAAANANARGDDRDAQWWNDISQLLGQRRRTPA